MNEGQGRRAVVSGKIRVLTLTLALSLAAPACDAESPAVGEDSAGDALAGDAAADAQLGDAASRDTALADASADTAGGPPALRGPCPMAERLGGFAVERQESWPVVSGDVANGVVPVTVLTLVSEVGACALLRRETPYCSPQCVSPMTCDLDDTCVPYPESQDIGVVSVEGLSSPVAMSVVQPGNRYFATGLSDPLFEAGQLIALSAPGGIFGPIALYGRGVERLPPIDGAPWVVAPHQTMEISWTPPAGAPEGRVYLTLNVDQHGNSPVSLRCDLEDTGSATIPASLVDKMLELGVSGFPNGSLTRRTVDSQAVTGGCVELVVATPRKATVRVAGHTACDGPDQCPSGQTCDLPTNTCK